MIRCHESLSAFLDTGKSCQSQELPGMLPSLCHWGIWVGIEGCLGTPGCTDRSPLQQWSWARVRLFGAAVCFLVFVNLPQLKKVFECTLLWGAATVLELKCCGEQLWSWNFHMLKGN